MQKSGVNEMRGFNTADELAVAAAREWVSWLSRRRPEKRFCVALSGGRIARAFFDAVVDEARSLTGGSPLELFKDVHFFWADERCVPPEHPESNFKIARESLLLPLEIPDAQVHRIRGEEPPELSAQYAAEDLRRTALLEQDSQPVLDLVVLGVGEDGHVASLFPGEPEHVASSPEVFRAVLNSPKPPPERVTLGYPALAVARKVWVLASGSGKESALRDSLAPDGHTPLGRVLRSRSRTVIFTDVPGVGSGGQNPGSRA